jgi:hypothetical protein
MNPCRENRGTERHAFVEAGIRNLTIQRIEFGNQR